MGGKKDSFLNALAQCYILNHEMISICKRRLTQQSNVFPVEENIGQIKNYLKKKYLKIIS